MISRTFSKIGSLGNRAALISGEPLPPDYPFLINQEKGPLRR